MRRHGLVSFYALAYGLSWLVWLPFILSQHGLGVARIPFPELLGTATFAGVLPGAYLGPLGAAFVVTAVSEGRAGLCRWGGACSGGASTGGGTRSPSSGYPRAILTFTAFAVALSVVITWVFNRTDGSLPVVTLLHVSNNNFASVLWFAVFTTLAAQTALLGGVIGFGVVALVLVAATRGRLGYRPEEEHRADESANAA